MKRAGAETMIMQYLRQLVKDDRFEFSILVHGYDKGDYDDEIATFGVPIYHVPVRGKHPLTYTHEVKKSLRLIRLILFIATWTRHAEIF